MSASSRTLESLIPRFYAGTTVVARDDGSSVVVTRRGEVVVEVAQDQSQLVQLIDGRRSVAQIAHEHFAAYGFVPFQALLDLLSKLRSEGALTNPDTELDGRVPRLKVAFMRRFGASRLLRIPLPLPPSVVTAFLAALSVAALGAAVFGLTHDAWQTAKAPSDFLQEPWGALAMVAAGVSATIALRSVLRGAVSGLWGQAASTLELRVHFGLLSIEADPTCVVKAARRGRLAAHASSLLAGPVLALITLQFLPAHVSQPMSLGALLLTLLDTCPFAPTSMGQWLATLAGRIDLRDHARSYLSRRFISRLGKRSLFAGEHVIVLTATASLLWCAVAVDVAVTHAPALLTQLWVVWAGATGARAVGAAVALGLVCAASLLSFGVFLRMAWAALASAAPESLRNVPAAESSRTQLSTRDRGGRAVLRAIPLFARLDDATLDALAKETWELNYKPGDVVVRQGDAGDRFLAIVEGEAAVEVEEASGKVRVVARLQTHDCFGERALLESAPRSATVRAASRLSVVSLSREAFGRLVAAMPNVDLTQMIRAGAALNKSAIFKNVAAERMAAFIAKLEPVTFKAGAVLCTKGERGDYFYLIDAGTLYVHGEDEVSVATQLGPGDHFGEIALLRDAPRTATVRAGTDCTVWRLSAADFYALLESDLRLSVTLEAAAGARLR